MKLNENVCQKSTQSHTTHTHKVKDNLFYFVLLAGGRFKGSKVKSRRQLNFQKSKTFFCSKIVETPLPKKKIENESSLKIRRCIYSSLNLIQNKD